MKFNLKGLVSIIIGLLLILIPTSTILSLLQFIIGFGIILTTLIPALLVGFDFKKNAYLLTKTIILIILGCVIMFWGFDTIGSVVGVVTLVFLIIDLVNSKNKKETLKKDAVKYLISGLLIFVGINSIVDILVFVAGIILIIFGIIDFIFANKTPKQESNNNKVQENVIDVEFEEHEK
ncbi:MAG: hypothetical protein IJX78_02855 [Bacilli bacterium]|nr:hypothetical protein [Bacilli bacterium]